MTQKIRQAFMLLFVAALLVNLFPWQVTPAEDANLEQHRNQLRTMQDDLQSLDATFQDTLNQARSLEQQVSDLRAQSVNLEQQMTATKQQIADRNKLFKERIRVMYLDGNGSFLSVLLDAQDIGDFLERFDMLTLIARHDKSLFDSLNQAYKSLESEQHQLLAKQQEQEKKQQQLLALEGDLQAKLTAKQTQISTVQSKIMQEEQEQQQLERQQQATLSARGDFTLTPADQAVEMVATAYTASGSARTATGTTAAYGTVAVDPRVIPLGTKLYIEGYGYGVASDTGLAIQGNRIDLFFNSVDQCILFGRKVVKVYLLK